MSDWIDIYIEGFEDDGGDFIEIITKDLVVDIPLSLINGYGTGHGTGYGYRL